MKHSLLLSPASWIGDEATGREYIVLETSTLDSATNRKTCWEYGAILPEARSKQDISFLNKLDAELLLLGMNDKQDDGHWVWDSDGTSVQWMLWLSSGSSQADIDVDKFPKTLVCQKKEGRPVS